MEDACGVYNNQGNIAKRVHVRTGQEQGKWHFYCGLQYGGTDMKMCGPLEGMNCPSCVVLDQTFPEPNPNQKTADFSVYNTRGQPLAPPIYPQSPASYNPLSQPPAYTPYYPANSTSTYSPVSAPFYPPTYSPVTYNSYPVASSTTPYTYPAPVSYPGSSNSAPVPQYSPPAPIFPSHSSYSKPYPINTATNNAQPVAKPYPAPYPGNTYNYPPGTSSAPNTYNYGSAHPGTTNYPSYNYANTNVNNNNYTPLVPVTIPPSKQPSTTSVPPAMVPPPIVPPSTTTVSNTNTTSSQTSSSATPSVISSGLKKFMDTVNATTAFVKHAAHQVVHPDHNAQSSSTTTSTSAVQSSPTTDNSQASTIPLVHSASQIASPPMASSSAINSDSSVNNPMSANNYAHNINNNNYIAPTGSAPTVITTNSVYTSFTGDLPNVSTSAVSSMASAPSIHSAPSTHSAPSAPVSEVVVGSVENGADNNSEQQEEDLCIVCMESPKNAILVHGTSGHQCCCLECGLLLHSSGKLCPICRDPIAMVIRNFKS